MNKIKKARGFSLIELMVVIAIIAIIIALVVPNFMAIQRRQRIMAAAEGMAEEVRLFRERALSMGGEYRVSFLGDNKSYVITRYLTTDTTTDTRILANTTGGNIKFGRTVANNVNGFTANEPNLGAPPANGIDFLPSPPNILICGPRGSTNKGVIYITDGQSDYAVGINSIGKVKVYKWSNGQWW